MGYDLMYHHRLASREGPVERPDLRYTENWPESPREVADLFIAYLETTTERSWLMEYVRSKDGKKHCALSHAYCFAGNKGYEMMEMALCGIWQTYAINDGKNPDYPQATPKARIIAALNDYGDGRRMDLYAAMEAEYQASLSPTPEPQP